MTDSAQKNTKIKTDKQSVNWSSEKNSKQKSKTDTIDPSFKEAAEKFLKKQQIIVVPSQVGGKFTTFYCTKENLWKPISTTDLKLFAIGILDEDKDTKKNREEIVEYARAIMIEKLNNKELIIPEWDVLLPHEIPFLSGILDINTNILRPIKPEDYLTAIIPHRYDPSAKCNRWLRALDDWGLDEKQKLTLQEFFGYILSNSTGFKKAMLLVGETDTGKSRPVYIAEYMVGLASFCKIDPAKMKDSSELSQIYGKKLNGIHELGQDSRLGKHFREVIDNNPISINEKFIPRFSYKPCCKHMFATNEFIGLDKNKAGNEASLRRTIIINFKKKIEKQDSFFNQKIYAEISGVINWAIEGLKRLLKNGQFTDCSNEDSEMIINDSKNYNSDELSWFVKNYEGFEFDLSYEIKKDDFFRAFMLSMGFDPEHPPEKWNKVKIGRELAASGFKSYYRGGKIPMYKGLRLKQSNELKDSKEQAQPFVKNELKF